MTLPSMGYSGKVQPDAVPFALWAFGSLMASLQTFHACGVLHRDIKPANCGLYPKTGRIAFFDLGLAKTWHEGGQHIPQGEPGDWKFLGSPTFASPNALAHTRPSRRDDVWACLIAALITCGWTCPWNDEVDDAGRTRRERQSRYIIKKRAKWVKSLPDPAFHIVVETFFCLDYEDEPPYQALWEAVGYVPGSMPPAHPLISHDDAKTP